MGGGGAGGGVWRVWVWGVRAPAGNRAGAAVCGGCGCSGLPRATELARCGRRRGGSLFIYFFLGFFFTYKIHEGLSSRWAGSKTSLRSNSEYMHSPILPYR